MTLYKSIVILSVSILFLSCSKKAKTYDEFTIGGITLGENISSNGYCKDTKFDKVNGYYPCHISNPNITFNGKQVVYSNLEYDLKGKLQHGTFLILGRGEDDYIDFRESLSSSIPAIDNLRRTGIGYSAFINLENEYVKLSISYLNSCVDYSNEKGFIYLHQDCTGTQKNKYRDGIYVQASLHGYL